MLISNGMVNSSRWIVVVFQMTMSGRWSVMAISCGKLYLPGRSAVIRIPGGS